MEQALQEAVYSLIAVWQVEVHNGIKNKAQLSAFPLLWIPLWWQKLIDVGISNAIHLLHATHDALLVSLLPANCHWVDGPWGKPLKHVCVVPRLRTACQSKHVAGTSLALRPRFGNQIWPLAQQQTGCMAMSDPD